MSSIRVLVTGGAGFLGSWVVDELISQDAEVVVIDSLVPQVHPSGDWPAWANPRANYIRADVRDRAKVLETLTMFRPHCVIHLAAEVGVGQAEVEIERYVDANVRGTAVLLAAILDANTTADHLSSVQRLIVAGSMSSYGEGAYVCPDHGAVRPVRGAVDVASGLWDPGCPFDGCTKRMTAVPIADWASLRPGGVYAATKRDQEDLSLLVGRSRGLSVAVARFFNLYGQRQQPGNPYTGVVAGFGERVRAGLAPRVYEDGNQARDFVHVSDAARAVMTLVGSWQLMTAIRMWQTPEYCGSFNVATGQATTILSVAELACSVRNVLRPDAPPLTPEVPGIVRTADIRTCYGSPERLTAIGWAPVVTAEEGLRQYLAEMMLAPPTGSDLDAAHRQVVDAGVAIDLSAETPEAPSWG